MSRRRARRPTMPFGKHKGVAVAAVPDEYLTWLAGEVPLLPLLRQNVQSELERRGFRTDTMAPAMTKEELAERKAAREREKGLADLAKFKGFGKIEEADRPAPDDGISNVPGDDGEIGSGDEFGPWTPPTWRFGFEGLPQPQIPIVRQPQFLDGAFAMVDGKISFEAGPIGRGRSRTDGPRWFGGQTTLFAPCTREQTGIEIVRLNDLWDAAKVRLPQSILVDQEIMGITGADYNPPNDSFLLTVVRGVEGTTAAAHDAGAIMTLCKIGAFVDVNMPRFGGALKPGLAPIGEKMKPRITENAGREPAPIALHGGRRKFWE